MQQQRLYNNRNRTITGGHALHKTLLVSLLCCCVLVFCSIQHVSARSSFSFTTVSPFLLSGYNTGNFSSTMTNPTSNESHPSLVSNHRILRDENETQKIDLLRENETVSDESIINVSPIPVDEDEGRDENVEDEEREKEVEEEEAGEITGVGERDEEKREDEEKEEIEREQKETEEGKEGEQVKEGEDDEKSENEGDELNEIEKEDIGGNEEEGDELKKSEEENVESESEDEEENEVEEEEIEEKEGEEEEEIKEVKEEKSILSDDSTSETNEEDQDKTIEEEVKLGEKEEQGESEEEGEEIHAEEVESKVEGDKTKAVNEETSILSNDSTSETNEEDQDKTIEEVKSDEKAEQGESEEETEEIHVEEVESKVEGDETKEVNDEKTSILSDDSTSETNEEENQDKTIENEIKSSEEEEQGESEEEGDEMHEEEEVESKVDGDERKEVNEETSILSDDSTSETNEDDQDKIQSSVIARNATALMQDDEEEKETLTFNTTSNVLNETINSMKNETATTEDGDVSHRMKKKTIKKRRKKQPNMTTGVVSTEPIEKESLKHESSAAATDEEIIQNEDIIPSSTHRRVKKKIKKRRKRQHDVIGDVDDGMMTEREHIGETKKRNVLKKKRKRRHGIDKEDGEDEIRDKEVEDELDFTETKKRKVTKKRKRRTIVVDDDDRPNVEKIDIFQMDNEREIEEEEGFDVELDLKREDVESTDDDQRGVLSSQPKKKKKKKRRRKHKITTETEKPEKHFLEDTIVDASSSEKKDEMEHRALEMMKNETLLNLSEEIDLKGEGEGESSEKEIRDLRREGEGEEDGIADEPVVDTKNVEGESKSVGKEEEEEEILLKEQPTKLNITKAETVDEKPITDKQQIPDHPREEKETIPKTPIQTKPPPPQPKKPSIIISSITWNLAESSPTESESSFLRRFRSSDIVFIGGQECENTKPRRSEGHRSREFRRLCIKHLGKQFIPLAIHGLGGVQCALFCKREILGNVDMVTVADVACGVGNVFHNKGAIGVFVQMKVEAGDENNDNPGSYGGGKFVKLLFVTAHLAAHVKNIDARNADYWRIASELEAQAPPRFLPPKRQRDAKMSSAKMTTSTTRGDSGKGFSEAMMSGEGYGGDYLMESMHHVIFSGDLNYRLDLPREMAEYAILQLAASSRSKNQKKREVDEYRRDELLLYDQLLYAMSAKHAFPDFNEGKIAFAPTFKYDKGKKVYDTGPKQRVPAWTDRVLFKARKGLGVEVLEYDCVEDAIHSDHRPVYATLRVELDDGSEGGKAFIRKKKRKKRDDKGT